MIIIIIYYYYKNYCRRQYNIYASHAQQKTTPPRKYNMADHSHPGPGVVTQERESRSEDEVVGDDIDEESALKRAEV